VSDGGDAPGDDGDRVADLRPLAIDEPAEEQQADGVRALEKGVGQAELGGGPVKLGIQVFLDEREDLTIDVVDRRGQEQQGADHPAVIPDHRGLRNGQFLGGRRRARHGHRFSSRSATVTSAIAAKRGGNGPVGTQRSSVLRM
jgi:hypothetical protein